MHISFVSNRFKTKVRLPPHTRSSGTEQAKKACGREGRLEPRPAKDQLEDTLSSVARKSFQLPADGSRGIHCLPCHVRKESLCLWVFPARGNGYPQKNRLAIPLSIVGLGEWAAYPLFVVVKLVVPALGHVSVVLDADALPTSTPEELHSTVNVHRTHLFNRKRSMDIIAAWVADKGPGFKQASLLRERICLPDKVGWLHNGLAVHFPHSFPQLVFQRVTARDHEGFGVLVRQHR
eukprot:scaffold73703_cov36-Phaeocystis_antarctica.AAC.3